jgi:uncharacterized coiled-coil protein SlyX
MPEDRMELDAFLEEMIASISKKFKEQEEKINKMEKQLGSLKKEIKLRRLQMDRSVLRVLRGK